MGLSHIQKFAVRVHGQLDPDAWPSKGLSPLNKFLALAIVASVTLIVLGTEPTLYSRAPWLFDVTDIVFGLLFTVEYAVRVSVAGVDPTWRGIVGRLKFASRPMALIDLLAILPFWLGFGMGDTILLRFLRFLRIVTLAKLSRYSTAFSALVEAVNERRYELLVTLSLAGAVMLASATLMFVAERDVQPDAFGSIPRALWWSVATMTTVGYGDVFPVTTAGKLLAGVLAVTAIGVIAMPTGILAAAFSDVMQKRKAERELGKGEDEG